MGAPYNQRKPENTPLYQVVQDHYDTFKYNYNDKYGDVYGFFRPEIDKEIDKYKKCGIFKYGMAKVKCQKQGCDEEYYLPFSCHGRGLCPSCIQKYALELEVLLTDEILREVPMRHMVFCIPVRLRKNFLWHREYLNDLSRLAWKSLKTFMCETLKVDGMPGAIQSIETSGQYLDIQTHIHVLATDGVFTADGKFHKMPSYNEGAVAYFKSLWEKAIAHFCINKGFITKDLMSKMLFWRYTGFSIYTDTKIDYRRNDEKSEKAVRHIIRYIAKPPIALQNLTYSGGKVLYKGHFHKGKKQNFEIFSPHKFLAALTSHIPKQRQKYINYYGVFSSRFRGESKKSHAELDSSYPVECPDITNEQRKYKKSWAVLLKKVWEVDPLKCKKCGSEMKITSVITDTDIVRAILIGAGLWNESDHSRGPPRNISISECDRPDATCPGVEEVEHIPFDDGWSDPVYN